MRFGVLKPLTLLALAVSPAGAADWTTSYASLARTSYLAGEAVAPPFALCWEYENDGALTGAPLVAIGRTYLSDPAFRVWSLDLNDGKVVWKHDEDRDPTEVKCYNAVNGELRWTQKVDARMIHTPQVGQNVVYVATEAGTLYAFNQHDGSRLWAMNLAAPLTIAAADGDLVAIGSGAVVHGLKAADGSAVFAADLGGPVERVPVVAAEGVYAVAGGDVVALARDGARRWRVTIPKGVSARLAVTKAGILAGGADGTVRLLAQADGAKLWEKLLAGRPATVSGAGDVVFVGTEQSTLVGMRLADGAKLWSAALERGPVAGVSLSAGKLLVVSGSWVGALIPAPAAPEGLAVAGEKGSAKLTWEAAAANGSPISAYRVFRRRGANSAQVAVVPASTLSYSQEVLPGSIAYSISAVAANGAEGARSAEATLAKGEPLVRKLKVSPVPLDPRAGALEVTFELREAARVGWDVIDAEGRDLIDERTVFLPAGAAALEWEGTDRTGRQAEPGVYRVRIRASIADEKEDLARAFPVNWTFEATTSGLPGGAAGGGGVVPAATTPVSGGSAPGGSSTGGGAAGGGASGTGGSGTTDESGGNNGVRDHGAGEGRDGHGQGKGQGKGPVK